MKIESFGDNGKFGHVFSRTSGMAADKVGDDLLTQVFFAVDAVEDALKLFELLKRRFAHNAQYPIAGVLGGYFQAATYVLGDKLACVLCGAFVDGGIFAFVKQ